MITGYAATASKQRIDLTGRRTGLTAVAQRSGPVVMTGRRTAMTFSANLPAAVT
jgi:hypothetical protein